MAHYFSDREQRPRIEEEISDSVWGGIVVAIQSRIADGSFGYRYSLECTDGDGPYGCNAQGFSLALRAEIPDVQWPLDPDHLPPKLSILDLLEFCHRAVAKPIEDSFHEFFHHNHLRFEPAEGQAGFREDVNRILARNGVCYELGADGMVTRLAPVALREALQKAAFRTGDGELDSLLEDARRLFMDPDLEQRKEAVRKLWDAWERLKTVEPGGDKKSRATVLLDRATANRIFRETLEKEAKELTDIGNTYNIRHSETDKAPLSTSAQVDYLFHRLFALIMLLLRDTGREPAPRVIS